MSETLRSIARFIDHAVLHPTQTEDDLRSACRLCIDLQVASVCVKPYSVPLATQLLDGTSVAVSTVIGFPHGSCTTETKATEARQACRSGATELDMVVNVGQVLEGKWDYVESDIQMVVESGRTQGVLVKVIFECGLLTSNEQKIRLCEISERAGAAFVKTSTGFGCLKRSDGSLIATGATSHDVQLMRQHCSDVVGVKASGGIRSYQDAIEFVHLGATPWVPVAHAPSWKKNEVLSLQQKSKWGIRSPILSKKGVW